MRDPLIFQKIAGMVATIKAIKQAFDDHEISMTS